LKTVTEEVLRRTGRVGSGRQIEQLVDEAILLANIIGSRLWTRNALGIASRILLRSSGEILLHGNIASEIDSAMERLRSAMALARATEPLLELQEVA
jgi:hypothetical protein